MMSDPTGDALRANDAFEDQLDKALKAYNAVWDAEPSITADNVVEVRRKAMEAALMTVTSPAWLFHKQQPSKPNPVSEEILP